MITEYINKRVVVFFGKDETVTGTIVSIDYPNFKLITDANTEYIFSVHTVNIKLKGDGNYGKV